MDGRDSWGKYRNQWKGERGIKNYLNTILWYEIPQNKNLSKKRFSTKLHSQCPGLCVHAAPV